MEDHIRKMLDLSQSASPLYRPTSFWATATTAILESLDEFGFEGFRSGGAPLSYFVPTYGRPGNSLSPELYASIRDIAEASPPKQHAMIQSWIDGHAHALSDFRAFAASVSSTPAEALLEFGDCEVGNPKELFEFEGRKYSRSSLNYLQGLAFLAKYADLDGIKTVLEIGGGFGTLGHILSVCWNGKKRYIDCDIPPTCLFADYYLRGACPDVQTLTSASAVNIEKLRIAEMPALASLPNWKIADLEGQIDLFVNFISFQEMEPDVVENYLHHVRRLNPTWIMLRNMREGKQQRTEKNPNAGVEQPIKIGFYGDHLPGYDLVATDTTIFGYRTSDGFHSDVLIFKRS